MLLLFVYLASWVLGASGGSGLCFFAIGDVASEVGSLAAFAGGFSGTGRTCP